MKSGRLQKYMGTHMHECENKSGEKETSRRRLFPQEKHMHPSTIGGLHHTLYIIAVH